MKKILVVFLAFLMVIPVFAFGEGKPYARQIYQDKFLATLYIAPETYPEVCLTPFSVSSIIQKWDEPWYVRFAVPNDMYPSRFDNKECAFLSEETGRQYVYTALPRETYEDFLYNCENETYIIYDGSEGKAAYIDPSRKCAYGLLNLSEIGREPKLHVATYLDSFDESLAGEELVATLTQMIVTEIARIESSKSVAKEEQYWSFDQFAGVKTPSIHNEGKMLVLDMPCITLPSADGNFISVNMYVTEIRNNHLTFFGKTDNVFLTLEVDFGGLNSCVDYKDDIDTYEMVVSNGTAYDVNISDFSKKGESNSLSMSQLISENAGFRHENDFLNLYVYVGGLDHGWKSVDDAKATLESIAQCIKIVDYDSDPYIPGDSGSLLVSSGNTEKTQEESSGQAEDGGWICPKCNASNTGNFCINCGEKKPEASAVWVCSSCNVENTG